MANYSFLAWQTDPVKRVLSGIQPTSESFHLGNYLGAVKQWVDLQNGHETYYSIVDLHALTGDVDPKLLRARTLASAAQLIAVGIDTEKSSLFVQSHLPEHNQLGWVMECVASFGEASRMTQFKDKSSKGGADGARVGLFTYPMLQAADILLYQADLVPVGEDQRQHIEITRDLANRFNTRYGQVFTLPDAYILKEGAKIYDLQEPTNKMSKSASSASVGSISTISDNAIIIRSSFLAMSAEWNCHAPSSASCVTNKIGLRSLTTCFVVNTATFCGS